MSINYLQELLQLIENGTIGKNFPKNSDVGGILDSRDSNPFDVEWMSAFNEVECEYKKIEKSVELAALIKKVRETSFKLFYGIASGGELASYASDDFDLIAKGICVDSNNEWLSGLLKEYMDGYFPCKSGLKGEVNLREMLVERQ